MIEAPVNVSPSVDLESVYAHVMPHLTVKQQLKVTTAFNHVRRMLVDTRAVPPEQIPIMQRNLSAYLEKRKKLQRSVAITYRDALTLLFRRAVELHVLDEKTLTAYGDFPLPEQAPKEREARDQYFAYKAFVEWCLLHKYSMVDCKPELFRFFAAWLASRPHNKAADEKYARLGRYWKTAAVAGDLPHVNFPPFRDTGRLRYGIPYVEWEPTWRDGFEAYAKLRSDDTDENLDSDEIAVNPATLRANQAKLGLLLGYITRFVGPPDNRTLVEILTDVELVLRFIKWHKEHCSCGEYRENHTHMLRLFARILRANVGNNSISEEYETIVQSITPVRAKPFYRDLITDFDRIALAAELCLRDAMIACQKWKEAGRDKDAAVDLANRFTIALLFALFTWRPMRAANMCGMMLGQNLVHRGRDGWWMNFSPTETKTSNTVDVPWPSSLVEPLEILVYELRQYLNPKGLTHLFLQCSGRPYSDPRLWGAMVPEGVKYLGIATPPHHFRRIVPTAYLVAHIGEIEVCRALLGHRFVETTLRDYAFVFSLIASKRVPEFHRATCPDAALVASWRPQIHL